MSDFLALDWERRQLACVVAHVSKSRVRVEQCFRLAWPADIDAEAAPDRAGNWLKEELRRRGIATKDVLVSLPREEAVVRRLELPDAPDDELPDLVRMQAATKSSSSLDQLLLDFLPLPREAGADRREVLMTTIPAADGTRLRKGLQAAGLELAAIGLSPLGAAEIAARVERHRRLDSAATSLVVARHGPRVEISLMRRDHLVFTHSALLEGGSEERDNQAILAEITRATVAQQKLLAGGTISRAWVLGTEAETRSLCEALQARLSCPAETIDPLALVQVSSEPADFAETRAALAGPIGMLLARAERTVEAIDFLSPRKPVPKTDRRKIDMMIRGGLVAALLLGAFVWLQFHLAALDGEIESRQQEVSELTSAIQKAQPDVTAANTIDEWDRGRVDWTAQMRAINESMTDRLYLTSLTFEAISSRFDRGPVGGAIARLGGTGYAKTREDANRFFEELDQRNYQVIFSAPYKFTSKDEEFPLEFKLDATLLAEKPAAGAAVAAAAK
jgi:Tfp pilus assembly PilM family ATPase